MLQAKLAAGGVAAAAAAHAAYVHRERTSGAPQGRLREFSPGSQDEIVSGRLHTGDLILFRRDCTLYACAGGLACALAQAGAAAARPDAPFDHVGVIVRVAGVPHVLERTFSGTKLRRYDHRVKLSRSPEVVVRPLAARLPPPAERELERWARAVGGLPPPAGGGGGGAGGDPGSDDDGGDLDAGGGGAISQLLVALPAAASGGLRAARSSPAVDLVAAAYARAGLLRGGGVEEPTAGAPPRPPAPRLTLDDLLPPPRASARRAAAGGAPLGGGTAPGSSAGAGAPPPHGGAPDGGPPPLAGVFAPRDVWVRDLVGRR